jgi:Uma2 family endonuclease
MTFEEFLERVPHNWHAEWVDGEVYVFMSTDIRHARVLAFLYGLIQQYVLLLDLGEVFFPTYSVHLRGGRSYREPDIFVVLHEHRDRIRKNGVHGPADFILEGISDDDPDRDRVEKFHEFEAAGVPEYVYVDTRDKHQDKDFRFVRRDAAGAYRDVEPDEQGRYHSQVLPGFWIDPRWLREDPLPNIARLLKMMAPDAYRRQVLALLAEDDQSGT